MFKRSWDGVGGFFGSPYDEKFPFEMPETIKLTEINTMTENEWKCCVEAAVELTKNINSGRDRLAFFLSTLKEMVSIRTSAVLMMAGDYNKAEKREDKPA